MEEKFIGFTKDVKTFTLIILDEEYKKPFKKSFLVSPRRKNIYCNYSNYDSQVCGSLGSVSQGVSKGLLRVEDMRQNVKTTLKSGGCSSFSFHVQVGLKSNMDEESGSYWAEKELGSKFV